MAKPLPRDPVSVVVPFLGGEDEARAMLGRLLRLRTRSGDELIVADNTPGGIVAPLANERARVVAAADRRSASHARNLGARTASAEWLLFIDADCAPPEDLLDRYFAEVPGPRCAIVAGEIEGMPHQDALVARWSRSRRGSWVRHHLSSGPHPAGITANLLVRRSAFDDLGGFRIGGGGDLDLCWRAQDSGWELVYRADVIVRHRDRETLAGLVDQAISYGSDQRRLRRMHGPTVQRLPLLRLIAWSLAGAVAWTARGRFEQARFKLVDALWFGALGLGQLTGGPRERRAD
ncbi:MAG: glycosyltransferase [Solirubrobacterales bacterium]